MHRAGPAAPASKGLLILKIYVQIGFYHAGLMTASIRLSRPSPTCHNHASDDRWGPRLLVRLSAHPAMGRSRADLLLFVAGLGRGIALVRVAYRAGMQLLLLLHALVLLSYSSYFWLSSHKVFHSALYFLCEMYLGRGVGEGWEGGGRVSVENEEKKEKEVHEGQVDIRQHVSRIPCWRNKSGSKIGKRGRDDKRCQSGQCGPPRSTSGHLSALSCSGSLRERESAPDPVSACLEMPSLAKVGCLKTEKHIAVVPEKP